ncbi:farnesol dehydrogenase-like [Uranotaenia lowii]|uniref:farnesol dehydrogenase-like n=1 Tax=Uranotaenia lowii TaxID=190385 RepID=UPI002479FDCE|nr:farnesol dehydrogenase-like [Uranotaenia lowii]
MDRWVGKVAVVTGASAGIGAAIAKELVRAGLLTVGLARRVELVEALKGDLASVEIASRLHAVKCDVSKEEDILSAFGFICEKFGGIDVLVNNAGVSRDGTVLGVGNSKDLRDIFDTNVIGLALCSREAYQSMKKRSVDGHIINIGSLSGHQVYDIPRQSIYSPSKFAVRALTDSMRIEMRNESSRVKVTCISPGIVMTDMVGDFADAIHFPTLLAEDIADSVRYVLSTPPRVQIHELVIRPNGEPF